MLTAQARFANAADADNDGRLSMREYLGLAGFRRSFSDCAYPPTVGCNNPLATNYNPSAIGCDVSNPRCCTGFTRGCSDSRFANYDPDVDNDDGSCYKVG